MIIAVCIVAITLAIGYVDKKCTEIKINAYTDKSE